MRAGRPASASGPGSVGAGVTCINHGKCGPRLSASVRGDDSPSLEMLMSPAAPSARSLWPRESSEVEKL